ncbi:MAG: hypothetical protein DIU80_010120 [Chloroflexota bacterium]
MTSSVSPSPQPIPSRCVLWIVIALVGAAVTVIACTAGGAFIAFGGVTAYQSAWREADTALEVVQAFMDAGAAGDAAAGYALFDPGASVTEESVAQLFAERSDVFQGSPTVALERFTVHNETNGISASLEGKITYVGDRPVRKLEASLRRVDERWRLVSIQFADSLGS